MKSSKLARDIAGPVQKGLWGSKRQHQRTSETSTSFLEAEEGKLLAEPDAHLPISSKMLEIDAKAKVPARDKDPITPLPAPKA